MGFPGTQGDMLQVTVNSTLVIYSLDYLSRRLEDFANVFCKSGCVLTKSTHVTVRYSDISEENMIEHG